MIDPQMPFLLDGKYHPGNETTFDLLHAYSGGSWVSEELHARGVDIQYIKDHFESLMRKLSLQKIDPPDGFSMLKLEEYLGSLIKRNRHFGGNILEASVYNLSGRAGRKVSSNLLLGIQTLEYPDFRLNNKGLSIDIFDDINKPLNRLSGSSAQYPPILQLAGKYRDKKALDDCLVLNQQGHIIESMVSNVFLVSGNSVLTPHEKDGCQMTVIRNKLLKIIAGSGHKIIESTSILPRDLLQADEVFLADIRNGIRWVVAFRQKRYYKQFARIITELLNRDAFGDTNSFRDSQES